MNNIFLLINLILNLINLSFCNNLNNNNEYKYNVFPKIIKKVMPAIVNIYIKGNKYDNNIKNKIYNFIYKNILKRKYFGGLGSGVIIDSKNGYILTNYHVINNSNLIKIQLYNKKELQAKLIDFDTKVDLALLKIISPFKNLVDIKISDFKNINVGDQVIAIGNPFGLGQTVTFGIISALGRSGINIHGIENFIQTDASINKGNSGGALINTKGELIGINTAILSPTGVNIGIGFAIPSNTINGLINQIKYYGKIKKYNIGIHGITIDNYISKKNNLNINYGVLIKEIDANSIAKKCGLLKNDIILYINKYKIKKFSDLKYILFINYSYKKKTILKILRNNINIDILIKF
ncbi:S1C family serine protease [Candidatus Nardonella dryophthoridicola]|uniref:Serine endoprotease n=1 Tax=endosymbiont of Rhynchophorus ferrugineus TaxID=1972133 RepID=A0A2Z5TIF8_9GAMM|nr:trypsin-like peptidase domain-containing protein [Candidatus Nardonella dryophthoridicola]BBA85052.1 serine endoprotease [endosymbiont of Rhynchophorus ferrugineus]